MKESYGEGVATHTGPELCVASRKAGDEALVGVRAGRVLSPEISLNGVPTQSPLCGRYVDF
jgi:RNA-directed DNA polymerase